MKLLLDTNIVTSALLWQGTPRELFRLAATHPKIQLFTSIPLLKELAIVLARNKFASKVKQSGLTAHELTESYAMRCKLVKPVEIHGLAADDADDVVIGTAIAAHCDWLITGDKAMLSLEKINKLILLSAVDAMNKLDSKLS